MTSRILAGLAGVLVASSLLAAPGLDVTVLDPGVPERLVAGARLEVPLRLRNDGSAPWSPADGFFIAPHWRDSAGAIVQWDGARTPLPGSVPPGAEVAVRAVLEIPAAPGDYLLQWDVVQEGVRWLSEVDPTPPAEVPVSVEVGYAFTIAGEARPFWLRPGAEVRRRLAVRNDGSLAWSAGSGFAVSYHWLRRDGEPVQWDGIRTPLEGTVEPGQTVSVEARLAAPEQPGLYRLQWDVVEEGVTWLSAHDPSPPPQRLLLVATPFAVLPAMLAVATLLAGVLALVVLRRGRPAWGLGLVALADLPWCVASVAVVQEGLLAAAGQIQPWTGRLLTWAGAVVLALPLVLLPRRWRAWGCWGLVAVATAVVFADTIYERFFGDLVSTTVLAAAGQVGQVRASVLSLLHLGDLWLALNLGAGLLLVRSVRHAPHPPGRALKIALAGATACLLLAGTAAGVGLAAAGDGALRQVFRNVYLARDLGVLNFHALDLVRAAERRIARSDPGAAEVDGAAAWFTARAPLRAGVGPAFGAAAGRNLLMIQVESLQGFVIGLEVNGQEVTPFLDRWLRHALLFTNVTDQTAAGRSSDAELLTQASLLPPPGQVAAFRHAGNHFTGLAGILRERGYATLSAIPFTGSFWNRRLTHHAFGYSSSLFDRDFSPGETIGWGLDDRAFFAQMVPRLAALPRPFGAWLITLSLHHPFAGFPDRLKVLDVGRWEGTPFGNYLHTMRFFDRAFEDLVHGLEGAGLDADTVLVLWGDHDAGLEWTEALAELTGQRFDAAGWYLSQRVPLIIRVPGRADLTGVRHLAAGQQDVAPTVLALLGIDPAPYAFVGRNLLGEPDGSPVVGEYGCWQNGELLYLRRGAALEEGECYRIRGLERVDPETCRGGFLDAERQQEVSGLVLEHDLQSSLHSRLAAGAGGGR